MHAKSEDLFRRLDELAIRVEIHEHEPVFTVEEAKHLRGILPGGHCKNLFLRSKKGEPWLIVCDEDRQVDLKALARRTGAGRFSFASPERLRETLGVEPGSVTPFALINDRDAAVRVVLDAAMMKYDPLNYHPLVNTATCAIARDDLVKFIEACGHKPQIMDLDGPI
ncbi:MAG TPA: prolyl-tRNA synthetase associated domain-containing protein [Alphaproteobacteria bacterium]|nr:prolyl-tRNA synthetase associated domain-containing protein [Alphaproteobacteria bacterium]